MSEEEFKYFEFRGTGGEFFRIWIVNIMLTIVTFGIYSAWAKVRTNRYLYANTYLNHSSFEYHAEPIKILIGRLIVVALYGLFLISSQFSGNFYIATPIFIVFILAIPLLFRQAIAFRLKNTSYRNIPFRYHASIFSFYKFFIIHFFLNMLTFGFAFPYTYARYKALIIDNASYGNGNFSFSGKASYLYSMFLKFFAVMMILGMASSVIFGTMSEHEDQAINTILMIFIVVGYIAFIIVMLLMQGIVDAIISNWIRNHTMLKSANLKGEMSPIRLGVIVFTNMLLVVLTLGIYYPWAKVRYLKYVMEHTAINCQDYDQFISTGYEKSSAFAEETVDFLDIDLGL
ncbi:MAG: DUF898 domain-containing protein [Sulfurovum sp.]|nr:MAG: DUF898 domain-containing protein [Sulfurovum sp.]